MVEHVGGDGDREVTLCTRHHGFIRIAIEEGAHLVPVFVFGESQATKNLIKWKAAQRWTYKRFGFPMPFLPAGFKVRRRRFKPVETRVEGALFRRLRVISRV